MNEANPKPCRSTGLSHRASRHRLMLACAAYLAMAFHGVHAQPLLLDNFDDGEVTTGGEGAVRGGFLPASNNAGLPLSLREGNSQASVIVTGNDHNGGIVSTQGFVPPTEGFSLTVEVASVEPKPAANGHFIGLINQPRTFYRSLKTNVGLIFFGVEKLTRSGTGLALVMNDNRQDKVIVLHSTPQIDPTSYRDGFIATLAFNPGGWALTVDNLLDTKGNPLAIATSGSWTDAKQPADFYNRYFLNQTQYVVLSAQTDKQIIHTYHKVEVLPLGINTPSTPPASPEPSTPPAPPPPPVPPAPPAPPAPPQEPAEPE